MKLVKELNDVELIKELREVVRLKAWGPRYFELNHENQNRRTREWVHEDVFGQK